MYRVKYLDFCLSTGTNVVTQHLRLGNQKLISIWRFKGW